MANISKISPDDGSTILNIKDGNAVHWADNNIVSTKNFAVQKVFYKNYTNNGITWNTNDDYSITANGTSTAAAVIDLVYYEDPISIPDGDYIISGGINNNQYIYVNGCKNGSYVHTYANCAANEVAFSYPDGYDVEGFKFSIRIEAGQTLNNVIFKPMIRLASDPNTTYISPSMINKVLTENIRPFNRGDKYIYPTTNYEPLIGYVTSGGTEIYASIPISRGMYKDYNNISVSVSFSNDCRVTGRGINGYVIPIDSFVSNYDIAVPNITVFGRHNILPLRIKNTDSSAFNVTNNTPIVVGFNGTLTFTFS